METNSLCTNKQVLTLLVGRYHIYLLLRYVAMASNVFTVYLQSNGKQSLNIFSKNLWICTLTDNAIAEPK